MNILIIGSGGREHALAWRLSESAICDDLYCAPGNPGIAEYATCVDIPVTDIRNLTLFARDACIDLVVVGPEVPLVAGLADSLRNINIAVFGPSRAAAQLEGSKGFMKDMAARCGVPTAAYGRFTELEPAKAFIKTMTPPIVVKADGLAAGKGVVIAQSAQEAIGTVSDMLSGLAFGEAGRSVVVEEFLDGVEVSFFALSDGKTVLPFSTAQDHKRAFDGDRGPNTGGMGTISPAPAMTAELEQKVMDRIIHPTVRGMNEAGCPFTGVLFAGLMIVKGEPILLEFNTRFGDPECQSLMMRFEGDLGYLLDSCARGILKGAHIPVRWSSEVSVCVVMAADGYPGEYKKGTPIRGIERARETGKARIFHAGTTLNEKEQLVSNGGRVLGIAATGKTVVEARENAYEAVDKIDWPDGFCRRDIGLLIGKK